MEKTKSINKEKEKPVCKVKLEGMDVDQRRTHDDPRKARSNDGGIKNVLDLSSKREWTSFDVSSTTTVVDSMHGATMSTSAKEESYWTDANSIGGGGV